MTDVQKIMARQYLEHLARMAGGDVEVEVSLNGGFVVYRRGRIERFFHTDADIERETFCRRVRWLMEG